MSISLLDVNPITENGFIPYPLGLTVTRTNLVMISTFGVIEKVPFFRWIIPYSPHLHRKYERIKP